MRSMSQRKFPLDLLDIGKLLAPSVMGKRKPVVPSQRDLQEDV